MAIPFLNHLDLTDISQLQNALLHKTTSGVASAVEAKIIYDTGSSTIKYYDGTQWIELGGDTDNYVDSIAFDTSTGVLTLGRTGTLSDLTVDLDGRYQAAGNYDNYLQWQITDGSQTDDVASDQVVKFVANSTPGTAGAALTGNGTTSDPYIITYTFPNDNDDNYVDGMSLSGNTLTLSRTGSLSDLTQDLSGLGFVDGSGTQNYVAKWTPDGDTLGNSQIFDNGTNVGVNTANPQTQFHVDGHVRVTNGNLNIINSSLPILYLSTSSTSTDDYALQNSGGHFQIKNNAGLGEIQFQVRNGGQIRLDNYGSQTFTGTAAYNLSVDSSGNIIETAAAVTTDVLQGNSADSTNAERYITFVDNATGAQQAKTDANFRFNPSTDTLSVTNLIVSGDTTYHNETIQIVENNTISFEGTTADAYEVHLTSADATADRTQTLQDASGTIALLSDITGTNSGTNTGDQNLFSTVAVSGQSNVVADSTSDTLTLAAGSNVTITTNASTDTVTIASTDTNTQLATAAALIDVSVMGSNDTASFTHGLASKNLIVQLYDTTSGLVVHADVDHTSNNAISITFAATGTALANAGIGDIRVVVIDAKNGLTDKTVSYS